MILCDCTTVRNIRMTRAMCDVFLVGFVSHRFHLFTHHATFSFDAACFLLTICRG